MVKRKKSLKKDTQISIKRGKLFGGTVLPNNTLFGGTPDYILFDEKLLTL